MKQARFANQSARPRRALARDRLAPAARMHVGDALLGGVRRAKPSRRASSAAPRCTLRFRFCSLRCLVALAAVIPALVLVAERLSPEHAALPVGRTATR